MASAAGVLITQWRKMLGYVSLPPPPPLAAAARQAATGRSWPLQQGPVGGQRNGHPPQQPQQQQQPPLKVPLTTALLSKWTLGALPLVHRVP